MRARQLRRASPGVAPPANGPRGDPRRLSSVQDAPLRVPRPQQRAPLRRKLVPNFKVQMDVISPTPDAQHALSVRMQLITQHDKDCIITKQPTGPSPSTKASEVRPPRDACAGRPAPPAFAQR